MGEHGIRTRVIAKNWQLQFWLELMIKRKSQDYIWVALGEKDAGKSKVFGNVEMCF